MIEISHRFTDGYDLVSVYVQFCLILSCLFFQLLKVITLKVPETCKDLPVSKDVICKRVN